MQELLPETLENKEDIEKARAEIIEGYRTSFKARDQLRRIKVLRPKEFERMMLKYFTPMEMLTWDLMMERESEKIRRMYEASE